ncbi:response regulator transcription factor [Microbacterium sp.]|uniref:response regulator n=1 Tax=Microbacterium sp. TaxID=51671 RepID=UPI002735FBA0|nr:response regulator transcription factor [Microbacterium sp.]MDP3949723.1 response regulator transcription factor [Microbacterium sp.]
MTESIRVLLVDDQELIRVGFRLVLEAEPDMVVAGEAADGDEAIRRARELTPDVVLMDIRMPGLDGIAATEAIVSSMPDTRVLVLTTFDLDEYAFGAIRAGASGFLLKDAQRHEMTSAVRSVHRGDAALSPRITRRLLEHLGPRLPAVEDASDPTSALTERERDVFRTIARGLTNAEIAQELHLSESTVKTHVGRVLMKLEARDRIHAVILAHQYGMS